MLTGTDFLACSVYKFFGPHVGVLYGRREVLGVAAEVVYPVPPLTLPDTEQPATATTVPVTATAT